MTSVQTPEERIFEPLLARDVIDERMLERAELPAPVSWICYDYCRSMADRSKRHRETIRSHLGQFARDMPGHLNDITPRQLDQWLAQYVNPKTRANRRVTLNALFNYARRKGHLPEDRRTAAERTELVRVPPCEPGVFTAAQLQRLLDGAAAFYPEVLPYIAIAAFTGARAAEIMRLEWKDWDPEAKSLRFPPLVTKTKRRRIVQDCEALAAWMPKRGQGPIMPRIDVHDRLRSLSRFIRLPWKHNALRHSYASYHLELHGAPQLTAKNCGHSVARLERDYSSLVNKAEAERWFAVRPTP